MRILLIGLAALCVACGQSTASPKQPNIVLILADDQGWGSLGAYGARDLETPNLDRLAREGRRFTQAYAPGSVCSPSRYALLTGRYFWRTSVKDGMVLPPEAPLSIETDRPTVASLLASRGYRTAAIGKWHLGIGRPGGTVDWTAELGPGPRKVGFGYFFGIAANANNPPRRFIENEMALGERYAASRIMETLTTRATHWIRENRDDPFFLYFAPNAVHDPVAPGRAFTGSRYGPYGDFLRELDASVGQVLGVLDELGLAGDTLVIFTSDNGGAVTQENPLARRAIEAGLAINGDLRGGKFDEWEGGFREPFLVRWPGRVPANSVSDQVVSLTDLFATLAGIVGAPLPPGSAEDSLDVLRAFTEPQPGPPVRDHVVLQSANAVYAIRQRNWKLIERENPPAFEYRSARRAERAHARAAGAPTRDQLFDLAADPSEASDVAGVHPDLVKSLRERLARDRAASQTRP